MTAEQIISLLSVIVAIIAILNAWYQTHKTQRYDKEKEALNIYANFLSLCYKISTKSSTEREKAEFFHCSVKLNLIADNKLRETTQKLTDKVYNEKDSDGFSKLVREEMNLMRDRLRLLNLKRH